MGSLLSASSYLRSRSSVGLWDDKTLSHRESLEKKIIKTLKKQAVELSKIEIEKVEMIPKEKSGKSPLIKAYKAKVKAKKSILSTQTKKDKKKGVPSKKRLHLSYLMYLEGFLSKVDLQLGAQK